MWESPLFWPVRLENDVILCLDETALPQKETYLSAKDLNQAIALIQGMKTRAFGQVLMAYNIFLLVLARDKSAEETVLVKSLTQAAEFIVQSRPTFPFAFFTGMVMGWVKEARTGKEDIREVLRRKIDGFLAYLRNKRVAQAQALSRLFKDGDTVLTHCNVSGSLVMAAEFCRQEKKEISFIATETRPYLQGARLTAWELYRGGFDVTVIPDSAVAYIMKQGRVNAVVTGADQMAQNGDIANKIGTYQIALLARQFNLPFYVLSPPPSRAGTGKDITIEIRDEKELLEFCGRRLAPQGVKGLYPAFDITPNNLITRHIGLEYKGKGVKS